MRARHRGGRSRRLSAWAAAISLAVLLILITAAVRWASQVGDDSPPTAMEPADVGIERSRPRMRATAATPQAEQSGEEPRDSGAGDAGASAGIITLRVQTVRGDPVANAKCWRLDESSDRLEHVGVTDPSGEFETTLTGSDSQRWLIRHDGFIPTSSTVSKPDVGSVKLVTMMSASVLRGRVVTRGGTPLSVPATVVAWPWGSSPPRGSGATLEDPRLLVTATTPDGAFSFSDVHPSRSYALLVLAPGWARPAVCQRQRPRTHPWRSRSGQSTSWPSN